jgi:PhnB protein
MTFAPYIGFPGTARAAMTEYAAIFGATDLQIMTFAAAPAGQRPPGGDDLVMHAQFSAGPGASFMGCDVPPTYGRAGMGGSSIHYAAPTAAQAQAVFNALAPGGQVMMQLGPTFWSPAYGMLTDRFGTHWKISVAAAPG